MIFYFLAISTGITSCCGFVIGFNSRIKNIKVSILNNIIDGVLLSIIYGLLINISPLLILYIQHDKNKLKNIKKKHNNIIIGINNRFKFNKVNKEENEKKQFEYWCPEGLTFVKTNEKPELHNIRKRININNNFSNFSNIC